LGYYPIANLPPENQENMPVEETANIMLMLAAIAKKKMDITFMTKYWDLIENWAEYLVTTALDPGNQLCTDDFEGPSPHNANLAAKGIIGLAAFSQLAELAGLKTEAVQYYAIAKSYAYQWINLSNDGNHSKLEYDLSDTWSLKYNLLWLKLLDLEDLFPEFVVQRENLYYLDKMNSYGVPLDNRNVFTKADWVSWIAALGTSDQFTTHIQALYDFANETPNRVPFSDWYYTSDATQAGFQCRPVMGAVFAKMLL